MIRFLSRRFLTMLMTLLVISLLVFVIIKLPPGDFLTNQLAELIAQGDPEATRKAEFLRQQYGLDRPVWEQYLRWIGVMPGPAGYSGLVQGDWGWSFEFDRPVNQVVGDALWLTLIVNAFAIIFVYIVVVPDRASIRPSRQYSWSDYVATLPRLPRARDAEFPAGADPALPRNVWFGTSIGGLMDPRNISTSHGAWAKVLSVLEHLWVPVLVIGIAGHGGMIRRLRANLLDELQKQYVRHRARQGRARRRGCC